MKRRYVFPPQCEYVVNEEARTVVCIIHTKDVDDETGLEMCTIENMNEDLGLSLWWIAGLKLGNRLPKHFSGKAVCAPGDKWNVEIGKKIARYRALEKYHYSTIKRMRAILELMEKRRLAVENRLTDEIHATDEYLRDLHREAFK